LGSDKTHLTVLAGDKKAWPVYLSIGNLKSTICNKPSNHAWVLIGYIPIVKFEDHKDICGTLENRLFHQCLTIILKPLVNAGEAGVVLADSSGNHRHCYPILAAYLADYPEQILLNIAAQKNSPTTTASFHDLGSHITSPPRTRQWIVSRLIQVRQLADPNDVPNYLKEAKKLGLNGVDQPFWLELPRYQPELCIAPDILHGLHRFWRDHILKWTRFLIGDKELDKRLRALQPMVGMRHFKIGISHLSQWTGREDRELQRVLLAVIAGAPKMTAKVMRNLRAFHDFLYLSQYRSHNDVTLSYMKKALRVFHATKNIFIVTGARKGKKKNSVIPHFNIPKMAALSQYLSHIREMGTSPQFSTEITENCHQLMAKEPFKATNRRDYEVQMCRNLDRVDRVNLMEELMEWIKHAQRQDTIETNLHPFPAAYRELAKKAIQDISDAELHLVRRGPTQRLGVWASFEPHHRRKNIVAISHAYKIPDLPKLVDDFIAREAIEPRHRKPAQSGIDIWDRFRIKLSTVQDEDELAQARTVEALAPSAGRPNGHCHCILVATPEAQPTGLDGKNISINHCHCLLICRLPDCTSTDDFSPLV